MHAAFLALLLLGCAGCQTFSLSEEQWQMQQQGKTVDRDVGKVVEILEFPVRLIGPSLNK